MRLLIVLIAATGCIAPQQPVSFPSASVGAASTNPDYWRRPLEVCGQVLPERGPNEEWILNRVDQYARYREESWLLVDARAGPLRPGSEACVRGVVRRPDGLTDAEALARGKFRPLADAPNTDYVLYPCSDAASCRAAGSRSPE